MTQASDKKKLLRLPQFCSLERQIKKGNGLLSRATSPILATLFKSIFNQNHGSEHYSIMVEICILALTRKI
jgi:hypothetical protein